MTFKTSKIISSFIVSLFLFLAFFSSCKTTQERQSLKTENDLTTLTNTNCKKCRTHGGDYLVFEVHYPSIKSDSLKKAHLKLDVYTNTGHNAVDLTVKDFELNKAQDKYSLVINYFNSNHRLKTKKISWTSKEINK